MRRRLDIKLSRRSQHRLVVRCAVENQKTDKIMRAKFEVAEVTPQHEGTASALEELKFRAVTTKDFDPDGNSEDNSFSRWTPTGELVMTVTNPDLHGKFAVGEKYYLDFSKAED